MLDIEYMLDDLTFNWNEIKAEINKKKHGITFEEAATSFRDINALILDDEAHSYDEDRFVLLGYSSMSNLLTVCHCYRYDDSVTRIISARKATNEERKTYEGSR